MIVHIIYSPVPNCKRILIANDNCNDADHNCNNESLIIMIVVMNKDHVICQYWNGFIYSALLFRIFFFNV